MQEPKAVPNFMDERVNDIVNFNPRYSPVTVCNIHYSLLHAPVIMVIEYDFSLLGGLREVSIS